MQRIVTVTALFFLFLTNPMLASSVLVPPELANTENAMPKLALIIDDLGYDLMPREIAALPPEISISIIPFTQFDTAVALTAFYQKREILLHLPMQSPPGTPEDPHALTLNMNKQEMQDAVLNALYRVPHAVAVNNHMGSLLTQHSEPMNWIMALLKTRKLGFIDSRTTANTVAQKAATLYGLANNRRHVFLDNEQNEDYIYQQIELAIQLATRHRVTVVIAHPLPITLKTLKKVLPNLQKRVELVPISQALFQ